MDKGNKFKQQKSLLIGVACGGLALLCFLLVDTSWVSSWHRVSDPPTQATAFAPSWYDILYVQNQAGEVFGRGILLSDSWIQPTEIKSAASRSNVAKRPCESTNPAFAISNFPPSNMLDCVQGTEIHPDGFTQFVYIIDTNHTIWQWRHTRTSYDPRSNTHSIVLISICLLVGLGVFGVFAYAYTHARVHVPQAREKE